MIEREEALEPEARLFGDRILEVTTPHFPMFYFFGSGSRGSASIQRETHKGINTGRGELLGPLCLLMMGPLPGPPQVHLDFNHQLHVRERDDPQTYIFNPDLPYDFRAPIRLISGRATWISQTLLKYKMSNAGFTGCLQTWSRSTFPYT